MFNNSRLQRSAGELRRLLALATPIIIAQLAYSSMGFVDTVMAGRVSPRDLAAVALGNSLWMPLFLMMNGILLATTAKVAQRFGGGRESEIGPLVRQSLWLALALGGLCALALLSAEPILALMKVEAPLRSLTMDYLQGIAIGFPAVALFQVLRCFSDGLGRTRPSMMVGICGLLLNIPLNYVLIHGLFGLPQLGGAGCGWASGIVMWCSLLGMLGWVRHAPVYRSSRLFSAFQWPQWTVIRRLLAVGVPIGVAIFAEVSIFSVIALLIADLGEVTVASHQIALNFSSMIFMIPYSLGMAATVRVGHCLGSSAAREARFAAGVAMATGLVYALLSVTLILLLREPIASIYSPDPAVISVAAGLLFYAAIYQLPDVIQVAAAGALRGYQDTRAIMLFTLLSYWGLGLPVGYVLGLTDLFGPASGPAGLWQGLVVGLSGAALLLGFRLLGTARRHIHR